MRFDAQARRSASAFGSSKAYAPTSNGSRRHCRPKRSSTKPSPSTARNPAPSGRAAAATRSAVVWASEQLARKGYAADSQELFVELTKRVARQFPGLGVKDLIGRQMGAPRRQSPAPQQRRSQSPPVRGNRNGSGVSNPGQNRNPRRVDLTRLDAKTMRMFGIDPSNKKATAYYAKEKLADIRRNARQERWCG